MAHRLHAHGNTVPRTLARLTALGLLLIMLWSPATVRGQAAPASETQGCGWAAGLVLSIGLMAAGAPLIVRGTEDSICFSSPCPDQRRGAKLLAGGIPMIMIGFGSVIGSAFGLRAANKEKRRLKE